jgi:hypothetical protein
MTRTNIISGDRLKTGDTEPNLVVQLIKDNGNPKDLSSGSPTVNIYIAEDENESLTVDDDTNNSVSITDAPNGQIEYSWQAGDTASSGSYIGEVEVVESSNTSTYPNEGWFDIFIEEGLN